LGSNPILHLYLPGSRIVPARVKVPVFIWGDLPNFGDWGLGKKILDFRLELTKTIQNPKSKIQN
jgi:hypothetical protein